MRSRTEKQKRLARKMCLALDPELTAVRQHARHLTRLENQTTQEEAERGMQLLEALFGAVGDDPVMEPPFHGDSGDRIFIGDGFS
jgi:maltose O-acetyltransferase